MSNNTTLNTGTGGDVIVNEDIGGGVKMPVSKIRLGAAGVDGGDVTSSNPFPVTGTVAVSGTVPVSIGSTVAISAASLPALSGTTTIAGTVAVSGTVPVSIAATVPISAASLPALSGTTTITGTVALSGTSPVSGTVSANQGTAAASSGAWPMKVTDGTNVGAVKAASTAAAATDPALVVAISPNNSVAITAASLPALSGTTTITGTVALSGTSAVSGTVTANQGTANSLTNGWPVKVTDGTNTMPTGDAAARSLYHRVTDGTNTAAVKAASTAAAATDPALVVAVSPNNTVPVSIAATVAISAASLPALSGTTTVAISGTPTVSATQGTAASAANAWTAKITDGTNTAAVKAASTAAAATDPALVVGLSPNSLARCVGNAGAVFDAATGAAVPANGIMHGLRAATANPTNATGGNLVAAMADKAGRTVVTPVQVRDLVAIQQTNVAVTTETTVITAGAAGVFNDLIGFVVSTAGNAAQTITIKDATAGTTRFVINYPDAALAPSGGPLVIMFPVPVPQAAAASNWTVTQSLATACNYSFLYAKNT